MRIACVTLSRSDYTSIQPILKAFEKDSFFDLFLIAGGSHLLKRYGQSIEQIKQERFSNVEVIDFLTELEDTPGELATAYSKEIELFRNIFEKIKPDMVFLLGDRWELIAPASVASILQIPIAHHSGGDLTMGSSDNQTRYLLTQLSHLHFTALQKHAQRLMHMGEEQWRVFVTGEPALLGLMELSKKHSEKFEPVFESILNHTFILATFHPTSFDTCSSDLQIDFFLKCLSEIVDVVLLTAPNPDVNSGRFYNKIVKFSKTTSNIKMHENLGSEKYYRAMSKAKYMIGNSSSGLWEAPSFKLPVINIGRRQEGRLRLKNVIDIGFDLLEFRAAVEKFKSPDFVQNLKVIINPYVNNSCIEIILNAIKENYNKPNLLAKKMSVE